METDVFEYVCVYRLTANGEEEVDGDDDVVDNDVVDDDGSGEEALLAPGCPRDRQGTTWLGRALGF